MADPPLPENDLTPEQVRHLLTTMVDSLEKRLEERVASVSDRSNERVTHFSALLKQSIIEIDRRLDLRIEDLTKAREAATQGLEKLINQALQSSKEAITKAEASAERRFDAVNEFRSQLADIIRTLLPRAEAEARIKASEDKIDALSHRIDRTEGKGTGLKDAWVVLIGAAGALAAIIAIFAFLQKNEQVAERFGDTLSESNRMAIERMILEREGSKGPP
jgi:hypothetical protein